MSLQSGAIAMGRKQAGLRMDSTCDITRVTGSHLDEATGKMVDTLTVIYTGICRLRYISPRVFEVEAAGQMIAEQRPTLSIPVLADGSGDVLANDMATITANLLDPAMVGVQCRIEARDSGTAATARRFLVEVKS